MSGEMNFEWVVGGVLLLVVCLIIKSLEQRGAFQVLMISFTFGWSTFVSLHFWESSVELVDTFLSGMLTLGEITLAGFWLGFLLAALPGMLLMRFWLRNYKTTFPIMVDHGILWGGALFVAACSLCLALMSLSPFAPLPTKTPSGRAYSLLRTVPARTYLRVASLTGGPEIELVRHESLLELVKQLSSWRKAP